MLQSSIKFKNVISRGSGFRVKEGTCELGSGGGSEKNLRGDVVTSFRGMVDRMCRRYFLPGAEHEDLRQEAWAGVVYAVSTFDDNKGKSLEDYVSLCIRNAVLAAVRKSTRKKRMVLNKALSYDKVEPTQSWQGDPERVVLGRLGLIGLWNRLRSELSSLELKSLVGRMKGYSVNDLGRRFHVTPKKVENALYRARTKAKLAWRNWEGGSVSLGGARKPFRDKVKRRYNKRPLLS